MKDKTLQAALVIFVIFLVGICGPQAVLETIKGNFPQWVFIPGILAGAGGIFSLAYLISKK